MISLGPLLQKLLAGGSDGAEKEAGLRKCFLQEKGASVLKGNQGADYGNEDFFLLMRLVTSPKRGSEYAVTEFCMGRECTAGLRGASASKEL